MKTNLIRFLIKLEYVHTLDLADNYVSDNDSDISFLNQNLALSENKI